MTVDPDYRHQRTGVSVNAFITGSLLRNTQLIGGMTHGEEDERHCEQREDTPTGRSAPHHAFDHMPRPSE